jgi:hypothetical protein
MDFMPLVWADGRMSPEATLLQARLATLSTRLDQFPEGELEQVYGQIDVRWIYAYGRANTFFLHIIVCSLFLDVHSCSGILKV